MKIRKTKNMRAAEARIGVPLEVALPELLTDEGLSGTADLIGVSRGTLGYWMLRLGIQIHRIAIGPGEQITVHRPNGVVTEIR